MPDSSPLLLETTTSSRGMLRWLLPIMAVAFLGIQVKVLLSPADPGVHWAVRYGYGAGAVIAIALFVYGRGRKGEVRLYPDRIEGRRAAGGAFSIAFEQVAEVSIADGRLGIKAHDGSVALVERLPEAHEAGAVWLCHAYQDLPAEVWRAFAADVQPVAVEGVRHFADESGNAVFGDIGCIVALVGQHWYLPIGPTIDMRDLNPRKTALYGPRTIENPLVQLYPSPDQLPIARFAAAIRDAALPLEARQQFLDQVAEDQGGNPLAVVSDGEWAGECRGMQVTVKVEQ
jgi:hypothetical protein